MENQEFVPFLRSFPIPRRKEMYDVLKNVPKILSPDLIKVLMEMGHGDEIVIADGNFPCYSNNDRVIRMDGNGGNDVLEAIVSMLPLD